MSSTTAHLRAMRAITGTVAVALLVAGCSTSAPTEEPSGEFVPATSGELNISAWNDYFTDEVIERFEASTGITLNVDVHNTNEEVEAKVRTSNGAAYDAIIVADYMADMLIKDNLALEVNAAEMPNGGNIEEMDAWWDPGRKYTSPFLYGTLGILYDADVIPEAEAPTSWADLFQPPASAGKVGIRDDQMEGVNVALLATGGDVCSTNPDELQAAQDLLVASRPNFGTISGSGQTDRMVSGEEAMMMAYNGTAHRVGMERDNAIYVYPEEGALQWQDVMLIPSGAPNSAQAKTFMNYFMDPENIGLMANWVGYDTGIKGSEAFYVDALKNDPALVVPDEYKDRILSFPACGLDARNLYAQVWETFKK